MIAIGILILIIARYCAENIVTRTIVQPIEEQEEWVKNPVPRYRNADSPESLVSRPPTYVSDYNGDVSRH